MVKQKMIFMYPKLLGSVGNFTIFLHAIVSSEPCGEW